MEKTMIMFNGKGGGHYRTAEALAAADRQYVDSTYRLIPKDRTSLVKTAKPF